MNVDIRAIPQWKAANTLCCATTRLIHVLVVFDDDAAQPMCGGGMLLPVDVAAAAFDIDPPRLLIRNALPY